VFDRVKEIDQRKVQPDRVQFAVAHEAKTTQVTLAAGTAAPFVATLRRVTEGMAQNAAMAMGAALRLGAKPEEIQERLRSWQPSPLRGEWKVSAGRRVYLDCYNANPASMADALAAFDALAPASEPRLLVIGCMEELGRDSQRYHLDFGRSLALRKGDHAIVIGGYAGAVRQGALESGCSPDQIEISDSAVTVATTLAAFQGWIFVKGSRRYELEKAFAGAGLAEASHA
jgi:UDP-N-acetylmuramoyl-tripeptide--D-alanyl-D-alanine ligase